MFIIELEYLCSLEKIDQHLKAHRDFLETYYQKGTFLASGPKIPRTGGVIIAFGSDKGALENILKQDPFAKEGIARYSITEFSPVKYQPAIQPFLETLEPIRQS